MLNISKNVRIVNNLYAVGSTNLIFFKNSLIVNSDLVLDNGDKIFTVDNANINVNSTTNANNMNITQDVESTYIYVSNSAKMYVSDSVVKLQHSDNDCLCIEEQKTSLLGDHIIINDTMKIYSNCVSISNNIVKVEPDLDVTNEVNLKNNIICDGTLNANCDFNILLNNKCLYQIHQV